MFGDVDAAVEFLKSLPGLYVVKTDGLAAGKGVLVTESIDEAVDDVRAKLSGDAFGDAGRTVVIEEGMTGPELSVLAVCDGADAVALAPAQDFKRFGDGDAGPNTGGMGAYSPVPVVRPAMLEAVMERAVRPTLAALRAKGIDYRGVLYAGLMLTAISCDGKRKARRHPGRVSADGIREYVPQSGPLGDLVTSAAHGFPWRCGVQSRFCRRASGVLPYCSLSCSPAMDTPKLPSRAMSSRGSKRRPPCRKWTFSARGFLVTPAAPSSPLVDASST